MCGRLLPTPPAICVLMMGPTMQKSTEARHTGRRARPKRPPAPSDRPGAAPEEVVRAEADGAEVAVPGVPLYARHLLPLRLGIGTQRRTSRPCPGAARTPTMLQRLSLTTRRRTMRRRPCRRPSNCANFIKIHHVEVLVCGDFESYMKPLREQLRRRASEQRYSMSCAMLCRCGVCERPMRDPIGGRHKSQRQPQVEDTSAV